MIDIEAAKRRALERVVSDGVAAVLDTLAGRVETQVPAESTFTRDEVAEMIRGMAEAVRSEGGA